MLGTSSLQPWAIDVLWFYFGYSSFITLHDDNPLRRSRAERSELTESLSDRFYLVSVDLGGAI
jgi:hypothetical protein